MFKMKKPIIILVLILITVLGPSFYIVKYSTGITGQTGAPGETTCAGGGCHSGGSSSAKGVTISAIPSFSANQYLPDSTYTVKIEVLANGFSRFGFGCEILDSLNADAGTMQGPGSGVTFATHFNGRKNAIHTTKKIGTNTVTFSFGWVAPSDGRVNFYACANAVNNNATTSGDLVIPASLELYPVPPPPPPPVDTTIVVIDGLNDIGKHYLSNVSFWPNPAAVFSTVAYSLGKPQTIKIELVNIKGQVLKELYNDRQGAGEHSQILNLAGIPEGLCFLRLSADGRQAAQKVIVVR
jgi:hypothetical protein